MDWVDKWRKVCIQWCYRPRWSEIGEWKMDSLEIRHEDAGFLWAAVGCWGVEWDYEIHVSFGDADSTRADWSGLTGPDYAAVWRVPASAVPCDRMPGATGAADPDFVWSLFDCDYSDFREVVVVPAEAAGSFGRVSS